MFENYSIVDFLSNIYKNKIINIILLISIFLFLSIPTVYSAINSKTIVTNKVNYSSYIVYKIESSSKDLDYVHSNKIGAYSDFYMKLLYNNLNGAFLLEGMDEETISKVSSELETSVNVLKNSDKEYWEKKIHVDYIVNNQGALVSILTPSKLFNKIVEQKFDKLIDEYKDSNVGVTVEKLPTIYSLNNGEDSKQELGYSKKSLIIKEIAILILSLLIVSAFNIFRYIFNPTINSSKDYKKYGIDYIYDIDNNSYLDFMLNNTIDDFNDVVVISTSVKIISKFRNYIKNDNVKIATNITEVKDYKNIILVEEYGVTRHVKFEKLLQNLNNLNRNVIGVVSYKL